MGRKGEREAEAVLHDSTNTPNQREFTDRQRHNIVTTAKSRPSDICYNQIVTAIHVFLARDLELPQKNSTMSVSVLWMILL